MASIQPKWERGRPGQVNYRFSAALERSLDSLERPPTTDQAVEELRLLDGDGHALTEAGVQLADCIPEGQHAGLAQYRTYPLRGRLRWRVQQEL